MKHIFNKLKIPNKTFLVFLVALIGAVLIVIFYKLEVDAVPIRNIENAQDTDIEKLMEGIKYAESQYPHGIGESPSAEEVYNNPYVKHIRVALNGYLDGSNNGVEESALYTQSSEDLNCGLSDLDRSYYQSKFIVYDVGNNDYGGVQTYIVFVDKPDTLFWTWVYQYSGGEYVLRMFCEKGPPDERKEEFSKIMKEIIKELSFSL